MKLQIYQSRKNKNWYWRIRARNGKITACGGGDGYHNRADVFKTLKRVFAYASICTINNQIKELEAKP